MQLRIPLLLVLCGCGAAAEGLAPGECTDDLDNDGDGLYDCADPDCANTMECLGAPTATGTVTGGGGPTGGPTTTYNPGLVCDFEGVLRLQSVTCNGTPATNEWIATYDTTSLDVRDDGLGFGRCLMTIRTTSAACVEEETFQFEIGANTAQVWFQGITFCDPASCQHTDYHEKCVVGERLFGGPNARSITANGSSITIVNLFAYQLPTCSGTVTTTWVPE